MVNYINFFFLDINAVLFIVTFEALIVRLQVPEIRA